MVVSLYKPQLALIELVVRGDLERIRGYDECDLHITTARKMRVYCSNSYIFRNE